MAGKPWQGRSGWSQGSCEENPDKARLPGSYLCKVKTPGKEENIFCVFQWCLVS